ncbi:hypothetical protein HN371_02690 [Candidatus Poribacteria bacterium]|nr:hypothetical protein [Candidatus Poribacteria bacterium]MBT7808820.1 hypothetical protein [Candidatus Poribacteria bacterium]
MNGQAPVTRGGIPSLLSALVLLAVLHTQSIAAPSLELDSPSPLLDVGDVFSVSAFARDIAPLFGASFRLTFDDTQLEYVDTSAGDLFLFRSNGLPFVDVLESGTTLAVSVSRAVGDSPLSRDGVVADMRFRALTAGIAVVDIDPTTVVLVTKEGMPIPEAEGVTTAPLRVSVGDGLILSRADGSVGTQTLASASGYEPGEGVQFFFNDDPLVPLVAAGGDGEVFRYAIDIPLMPGGDQEIRAEGQNSGRLYSATFTVTPRIIQFSPFLAGPGDSIHLTHDGTSRVIIGPGDTALFVGDGFSADEVVQFKVGGSPVQSVLTGDKASILGEVSAQVILPSDLLGGLADIAIDGRSSRSTATGFGAADIVPRILAVSPSSGGLESRVQVSASGFIAGDLVDLSYDGQPIVDASGAAASTRGTVRASFILTADLVKRSVLGAAPIVLSGLAGTAAAAPFVYTPVAQITDVITADGDTQITPGEEVRVKGIGFVAGEAAVAQFAGVNVNTTGAPADEQGALDVTFITPKLPANTYDLVVRAGAASASQSGIRVTGTITSAVMEGGSTGNIGALGTLLVVEGAGFDADADVAFDIGTHTDIDTTHTTSEGTFRAGIVLRELPDDLPEGTGAVLFVARDRRNSAETTIFISSPSVDSLETAEVRVSPAIAAAGDVITISGTGYAPGFNVGRLLLDTLTDNRISAFTLPVDTVTAGTLTLDGILTDPNGVFQAIVTLPLINTSDARAGAKEIATEFPKTPTILLPAIATDFETTASFDVLDVDGNVVTEVEPTDLLIIRATGFLPFETVQVRMGLASLSVSQIADSFGRISAAQIIIPNTTGGDVSISVNGLQSGVSVDVPLHIIPRLELLFPAAGTLVTGGGTVTLRGTGFPDGQVAFFLGDARTHESLLITSFGGIFNAGLSGFFGALPVESAIRAEVGDVSATTTATLRFLSTDLTLTPATGQAGDTVRVTGANGDIVRFEDAFVLTLRNTTNINGIIQGDFTVPPVAGGAYEVTVGTLPDDFVRPTFTVQATMTVSPDRLHVGESLFVSGSGFGTNQANVSISVGGARTPVVVPTTTSGRFNAEFPMPRTPGGPTQVTVTDQTRVLSSPVEVLSDVTGVELDPTVSVDGRAPVGSDVRILGVGFGPSEALDVFVASQPVDFRRSPTSGSDGSVDVTVALPPTTAGAHTVRVVGNTSGLSAVLGNAIDVLPTLDAPRPNRGAVGTLVVLTGAGFGPGELVLLDLGAERIGEVTTENDGSLGAEALLTVAMPDNVYDVTATGTVSGEQAVLIGAFDYTDSKAPAIETVDVVLSNDPLEIGDTITVLVTQAMDYDAVTEATFKIGDLSGILADDDGDLVWEGVVGIETGLSMTAIPVEVSLVDLAGNQAKRTSTTRVTVDTTAEFVNINVEVQNVVAAGQSVVVSGQALPGGAAAFSIDGIVEDVAMEETEEGVYTGSYIAKAGDLTDRATITISFVDVTGKTVLVDSGQRVAIDAVAEIDSVDVSGSPARAGDRLTFQVAAERGGSVLLSVPGLFADVPVGETRTGSGLYSYTHTVERQAPLTDSPVQVTFVDALENVAQDASQTVTISLPTDLTIGLVQGLNVITIPVMDPTLTRVGDILDRFGPDATFIISYDAQTGRFSRYGRDLPPTSRANVPVTAGAGYIVAASAPAEIVVAGSGWDSNAIVLSPGLNLVGLTRADPSLTRLGDFASRIGADLLQALALDPETGRFVSHLAAVTGGTPNDVLLTPGMGYILVLRNAHILVLNGPPPLAQ